MCECDGIRPDTIAGFGIGVTIVLLSRYFNRNKEYMPMKTVDYVGTIIMGLSAIMNMDKPFYSSLVFGGIISGIIYNNMSKYE